MSNKYLDKLGLTSLVEKIQNLISESINGFNSDKFIRTTYDKWKTEDKSKYSESVVFIEDTNQIWNNGVYYGQGLFIGTQSEYKVAFDEGRIPNGTIVIIDEKSTAKLGVAVLGQLILGQE